MFESCSDDFTRVDQLLALRPMYPTHGFEQVGRRAVIDSKVPIEVRPLCVPMLKETASSFKFVAKGRVRFGDRDGLRCRRVPHRFNRGDARNLLSGDPRLRNEELVVALSPVSNEANVLHAAPRN